MHVLDSLLLVPGAELADGCRYHVEAAPATGYLKQVNCSVEHSCRLFDVALMDVREGQISQDDRLRLVTALEPTRSPFQDRSRLRAVTKGEITGALYPSKAVGGEEAMGGIGGPH